MAPLPTPGAAVPPPAAGRLSLGIVLGLFGIGIVIGTLLGVVAVWRLLLAG